MKGLQLYYCVECFKIMSQSYTLKRGGAVFDYL